MVSGTERVNEVFCYKLTEFLCYINYFTLTFILLTVFRHIKLAINETPFLLITKCLICGSQFKCDSSVISETVVLFTGVFRSVRGNLAETHR